MKKTSLIITIVIIVLALFVSGLYFYQNNQQNGNTKVITNFAECTAAGNPVMESYPRQCRAGDKNFTEEIVPTLCTEKRPELCADIYDPVCAKVNVQCIKAPCEPVNQTYPNACRACSNSLVESFVSGECSESPKPNEEANIVVSQPVTDESVEFPLIIKGRARVFENTFSYRIKDGDGALLLERHAMADSPDMGVFGDFSLSVNYPKPVSDAGTVEVFEYSAKDGSEINKVSVPVRFVSVEATEVKVFYPNKIKDPGMLDCAKVYEISRRVPKTQAIARLAIEELLLGADRVEGEAGYFSNINSGVKIQGLTIQDGVAKIDFNEILEAGVAGSCNVTSIRSQIETTLKQFPTVKSVIISIDGRVDDILQP